MPEQKVSPLTYILSEKASFLVISFTGSLVWGNEGVVKVCQEEIARRSCDRIVLDLKAVEAANQAIIPEFVKLQATARQKGKLRVCGIRKEIGRLFLDRGAVREEELTNDLKAALESLGTS